MGHKLFLRQRQSRALTLPYPSLGHNGEVWEICVCRAVARALRAAAPAARLRITVDHGLAPLMLSGVVGATSPGVAARVAASPAAEDAAGAAVSDARRVVLRSHGAQFTFLVPTGRVDAALALGLLTWASFCF